MICISIGEKTVEGCLESLRGAELAEVRLDMLDEAELTVENIRKIFSSGGKLIATCRAGEVSDEKRLELLIGAVEAGAAYVDVEVEAKDDYKKKLVDKARAKGCKVIVSYHDHRRTPGTEEMKQIIGWCFGSGADIAKIACMVKSDSDNARLLGLLNSDKKLVVVGMGPKGKITRIVAPLLGSQFTFASAGAGKETAEGQLDRQTLAKVLDALQEAVGGKCDG